MMWEHRNLTLWIVRMLLPHILRRITALWHVEHRLFAILRLWLLLNRALHRLLHRSHYRLLWLWRHLSWCCLWLDSLLCRLWCYILRLCHLSPVVNGVAQRTYRAAESVVAGEVLTLAGSFLMEAAANTLLSFMVEAAPGTVTSDVLFTVIQVQ